MEINIEQNLSEPLQDEKDMMDGVRKAETNS